MCCCYSIWGTCWLFPLHNEHHRLMKRVLCVRMCARLVLSRLNTMHTRNNWRWQRQRRRRSTPDEERMYNKNKIHNSHRLVLMDNRNLFFYFFATNDLSWKRHQAFVWLVLVTLSTLCNLHTFLEFILRRHSTILLCDFWLWMRILFESRVAASQVRHAHKRP